MALLFSGAEPLCNFGRRHHENQFCEIILNLDQWFRKRSHLKYFLSRALVALLCIGEEPFVQFWYRVSSGIKQTYVVPRTNNNTECKIY